MPADFLNLVPRQHPTICLLLDFIQFVAEARLEGLGQIWQVVNRDIFSRTRGAQDDRGVGLLPDASLVKIDYVSAILDLSIFLVAGVDPQHEWEGCISVAKVSL